MDQPPPLHTLFRYRAANEHAFAEIADGQGWHSRYDALNDPFEGIYINQTADPAYDHVVRSIRALCFSQELRSHLLWAHYADNHRGMCLEYSFSEEHIRACCFPVRYSRDLPVLRGVERFSVPGPNQGALHMRIEDDGQVFLTKSQEWAYEQEYRCLSWSEDPSSVGQRRPIAGVLTGVYFGLRATAQTISVVGRLLHDRPAVRFYRAQLMAGEYLLIFEELPR